MRLTASRVDLAFRCAYPFRADVHIARDESAAAEKGTAEHSHIEGTISDPDAEGAAESETHARWIAEWWAHERETAPWQEEVAIALNPHTSETRLVERLPDGHRDYSTIPEGFIAGTADGFASVSPRVRVADWKTGQAAALVRRELVRGADGRLTARQAGWRRPSETGQLLTLGAAFARYFGAREAELEFVPVNEHRLHVEREVVGRLALRLHEQRLVEVLDEASGDARPKSGPWCSALYCPLLGHCPATASALAHTAPATTIGPFILATHSGDFQSAEHLGWQWTALDAAEKRLAAGRLAAKIALRERFSGTLPDGSTLVLEPQRRETIDASAPGVVAELERLGLGTAVERVPRVSKGSILEAVKPVVDAAWEAAKARGAKVKGITYAAAQAETVTALAKIGGVKVSEFEVARVIPPDAPPALDRKGA